MLADLTLSSRGLVLNRVRGLMHATLAPLLLTRGTGRGRNVQGIRTARLDVVGFRALGRVRERRLSYTQADLAACEASPTGSLTLPNGKVLNLNEEDFTEFRRKLASTVNPVW